MISKIYILLFTFAFFTQFVFSQDKNQNADFNKYSSSLFDSEENTLFVISNFSDELKNIQIENTNNVNIQQIGNYNVINANVVSENSNLLLQQNGLNNTINFNKTANEINQTITQLGNNNTVTDLTFFSNYKVNMEMSQTGNNQNIQNIGTNSLSKDMKISQSGNGTSIIIINQ